MKPRQFIARASAKTIAKNGGKIPFSSILSPRKAQWSRTTRKKSRAIWGKPRRRSLRSLINYKHHAPGFNPLQETENG